MRYTTAPCSCDLSVFKSVFAFDKYAGDDLAMSVSASPGSTCPTLTPHTLANGDQIRGRKVPTVAGPPLALL